MFKIGFELSQHILSIFLQFYFSVDCINVLGFLYFTRVLLCDVFKINLFFKFDWHFASCSPFLKLVVFSQTVRWLFRGCPYCCLLCVPADVDAPGVHGNRSPARPASRAMRECAATSPPQPQIGPGRPKTAAGDASFSFFSESRQHSINFRARSRDWIFSDRLNDCYWWGQRAKRWTLWIGGSITTEGPAV